MKERNWSDNHLKKLIIEQRKFMWREDSIEMYSRWMGLKHGITVVDVGCGLGYLGWTYWEHFGNNSTYFGLDRSKGLIEEASVLSKDWASNGSASFLQGDAYSLPFPDNFTDCTMCQTLLMHLEFPEKALSEMARITKPGGIIMCKEPDNLSAVSKVTLSSEMEISDDFLIQNIKFMTKWARGRKKLGYGDYSIALLIPKMMHDLGLVEIDSRCNDKSNFVQPPYETPSQKYALESYKKNLAESDDDKGKKTWQSESRRFYLAGGGTLSSYYRHTKRMKFMQEKVIKRAKKQVGNETWFRCWGSSSFFCIKARKPK